MLKTTLRVDEPAPGNVYLRQDAVASYARFADYTLECFTGTLGALERCGLLASKRLRILDLGVGPGAFALPLLKALRAAGVLVQLDGYDSSEAMLSMARRNAADADERSMVLRHHDLDQGLPPDPSGSYDLILTTFVLHYLHRWKDLLAQISASLQPGGAWLVSEAKGDIPLMEGEWTRTSSSGTVLEEFWREYHRQRSAIAPCVAELKPSAMGPVLDEATRMFNSAQEFQVGWTKSVAWRDVCSWIGTGITAALGAGLTPAQRHFLACHMEAWLNGAGIDLEMKVPFRMGVRLVLFHH